jgi:hypothetical protein
MSALGGVHPATFAAADAMQAAYFRACLDGERRQLIADIAKHEAELVTQTEAGHLPAIGRLRAQIRAVHAELRYVDKLVERLTRRFTETHVAAAPTAR